MKKLIYAAAVAMAVVSVSNVFAGQDKQNACINGMAPTDTVVTDTTQAPSGDVAMMMVNPTDTVVDVPTDTTSATV